MTGKAGGRVLIYKTDRMNKKDITKIKSNVAGILAVLWMVIIFIFSAQSKEESSEVSGGISDRILSIGGWFLHLNIDEETLGFIALTVERIIRKGAHMAEFAILALLLYVWLERWQISQQRRYWAAAVLAALYACTDELHQLFVPGRAGRVSDVLIDSVGAVVGLAVFLILWKVVAKKIHNRSSGKENGTGTKDQEI